MAEVADLAVVGACAFFGFTVPVALFDSTVLFTYHPTCMSMGFGLLMTLGWARGSSCARSGRGGEDPGALWVHAATQTLALFLALGGLCHLPQQGDTRQAHFPPPRQARALTIVLTVMSPTIGAVAFKQLGLLDAVDGATLVKAVTATRSIHVVCGALATSSLPHPAVDQGSLTSAWRSTCS